MQVGKRVSVGLREQVISAFFDDCEFTEEVFFCDVCEKQLKCGSESYELRRVDSENNDTMESVGWVHEAIGKIFVTGDQDTRFPIG